MPMKLAASWKWEFVAASDLANCSRPKLTHRVRRNEPSLHLSVAVVEVSAATGFASVNVYVHGVGKEFLLVVFAMQVDCRLFKFEMNEAEHPDKLTVVFGGVRDQLNQ